MNIRIIQDRLESYQCKTVLEEEQALKEITQEVILMSLSRQNYFDHAEFHGGTALRILYSLRRFSEDLDFALLLPNHNFSLLPYLNNLSKELEAFGYEFKIQDRSTAESVVKKAFLKDDSIGKLIFLKTPGPVKKLKIKIELDTNPPSGTNTETKYLDFPAPFGPNNPKISPKLTEKLILFTAVKSPNFFTRFFTSTGGFSSFFSSGIIFNSGDSSFVILSFKRSINASSKRGLVSLRRALSPASRHLTSKETSGCRTSLTLDP